eukprot:5298998-Amphidinium_carterae.1
MRNGSNRRLSALLKRELETGNKLHNYHGPFSFAGSELLTVEVTASEAVGSSGSSTTLLKPRAKQKQKREASSERLSPQPPRTKPGQE